LLRPRVVRRRRIIRRLRRISKCRQRQSVLVRALLYRFALKRYQSKRHRTLGSLMQSSQSVPVTTNFYRTVGVYTEILRRSRVKWRSKYLERRFCSQFKVFKPFPARTLYAYVLLRRARMRFFRKFKKSIQRRREIYRQKAVYFRLNAAVLQQNSQGKKKINKYRAKNQQRIAYFLPRRYQRIKARQQQSVRLQAWGRSHIQLQRRWICARFSRTSRKRFLKIIAVPLSTTKSVCVSVALTSRILSTRRRKFRARSGRFLK